MHKQVTKHFGKDVYYDIAFKSSISTLYEKTKIDEKAMNDALNAQFNRMLNLGYKKIHYLETPNIIDTDNDGTVHSFHFTDLGFKRYADF